MTTGILYKYIAIRIVLALLFFSLICLIFSELIGISFEQMRFIAANKLSINTSMYIHVFAAPKFFLLTMPYALFMANIFAYKKLSRSSEILALLSLGISIKKILIPSFMISLSMMFVSFSLQEVIVTESNYITATTLEKAMGIDRNIVINNFLYSHFNETQKGKEISLLLHAKEASNKAMKDLILLSFDNQRLQKIIVAPIAYRKLERKVWELQEATEEHINKYGHITKKYFRVYELKTKQTLDQLLTPTRDDNELNIFELKNRLNIFQETGHEKEQYQIEKIIQDRFIHPFSCITFALVGASTSVSVKPRTGKNEFGLGLIIILIYFIIQFIDSSLIGNRIIPVWSDWVPNFLGIIFASLRFLRFN